MTFSISEFFRDIENPELRSPEQTFLEYRRIHLAFSRACRVWLKENDNNLSRMNQVGARQLFESIRQAYCISKNRQYSRSTAGHYYLSEITDIGDKITQLNQASDGCVELLVNGIQAKPKIYKILLVKKGSVWLIDSIASSVGSNSWHSIEI